MQRGGNMVSRWAEVYEKRYQSDDHEISSENSVNIGSYHMVVS